MDNEIETLIQAFAAEIPTRQAEVTKALAGVLGALGPGKRIDWSELEYITHKFAGSSGTYGFLQLSVVCRYGEELCQDETFRNLAPGALRSHLERWATVFAEQCTAAAARRSPPETPDQLTSALTLHRQALAQRRVA